MFFLLKVQLSTKKVNVKNVRIAEVSLQFLAIYFLMFNCYCVKYYTPGFRFMSKKVLAVIMFMICLSSLVPISYFLNFGHMDISDKPENWAAFGDFIGGVLNPLLSFAAFIGVLITVFMQQAQLKQNQKQLESKRSF